MPAFEVRDRRDWAVVWEAVGADANGDFLVSGTPYETRVRWVDKQAQALDPQGNVLTIDAQVICGFVDIPVGSAMWKGRLKDLPGTNPSPPPNNIMDVVTFNPTFDIKNRFKRRELGLKRRGATLPTTSS